MNSKTCKVCGKEKLEECFSWENKTVKGKLYSYRKTRCIECDKEYLKIYYANNKERERQKRKEIYAKNKDALKQRSRANYRKNRDKILEANRLQRQTERYKSNQRTRNKQRYDTDPTYKLAIAVRNRIRKVLMGMSKSASSEKLTGCSWEELRRHLENQFLNGMTWENYGFYGWHIDHKIPLASAQSLSEIEALCHYTNLQPLWAEDNLKKGDEL